MVISTRSTTIAECAGAMVRFGARDPFGNEPEQMFMAHATSGLQGDTVVGRDSTAWKSILKILKICGGLPIALAITGSAVAFLSCSHGNFDRACDAYATRLEKKTISLGDEDTLEGTSFNAGILLSLEYLGTEIIKWKVKRSPNIKYSIRGLYIQPLYFRKSSLDFGRLFWKAVGS